MSDLHCLFRNLPETSLSEFRYEGLLTWEKAGSYTDGGTLDFPLLSGANHFAFFSRYDIQGLPGVDILYVVLFHLPAAVATILYTGDHFGQTSSC